MTVVVRDEALLRKLRRDADANLRSYRHGDPRYSVPQYPVKARAHPMIDVIFRAMNAKRITYDAVYAATGVAYNTLWAWKTNKHSPRVEQVEKVYKFLGIKFRAYIPGVDN